MGTNGAGKMNDADADADDADVDDAARWRDRLPQLPLTRRAVAARLHVTPATVRRWEKEGKLHPTSKNGKPWYDPDEVDELAEAAPHSEELDAGRLIAQLMTHVERILETNLKTTAIVADALEKLGDRITKLERQRPSAEREEDRN